jgi:uncharacterized protein YacL
MHPILRSVLAVLAGALVAFVLIAVIELLSGKLYPLHAKSGNPEDLAAAMARAPMGALLLMLLGWAVGTLAGAWTAARVAARSHLAHGLVVGVLFLCFAVANMLSIPHPFWFWIAAVALFLPCAYLGATLAARREPAGAG